METFLDKFFLKLVSFFYPLLERTGVNISQLQEILRVKLLLDNRRPKVAFGGRRSAANASAKSPVMIIIVTLFIGVLFGLLLLVSHALLIAQSFYFIIFMVLMSFTLISDFTTVLIDARDQYILLPRPVDDRTVAVSRILHIAIYVLRLALIQGLPGMVIAGYADKSVWASVLFLGQIVEATFLCILFVNIIYLLLMQFVSPQKFKDIISSFQVGFSMLIFAAYYLLPRLVDVSVLSHIDLLAHWWAYILPPVWIAALNGVLIHPQQASLAMSLLAVAGFVLPLAGLWFVARVLAPGFNKRLAELATSDGNTTAQISKRLTHKRGLRDRIANLVAPDPVENAGFRITWKLAARTREFKVKVYPTFAYVPVYVLYFVLSAKGTDLHQKWHKLQHSHSYIFFIYLSVIVLYTMLFCISQSEKYKAAWVYYALPIDKPGKILSGMYKAIISLYFLPYCLVLTIVMACIWGPQIIVNAVLSFLICTVCGVLIALFTVKGLPFSKPVMLKQNSGRTFIVFFILLFMAAFGYGHYLLLKWPSIIWILIIPTALLAWAMLHYYRKQSWESIELDEM
jgi:hypothetical protein